MTETVVETAAAETMSAVVEQSARAELVAALAAVEQHDTPEAVAAAVAAGAVALRVHPFELLRKKVAILGFTEHRAQAFALPADEFELWGLNELHRHEDVSKFHRWFEIHSRASLETDVEHLKGLAAFDIPVYMQDHYADIPPSLPFPRAFVEQQLDSKYFTSSPSWMIGMAIAMGAEEIHLYGVDMAQDSEYARERPCVEFWLGVARGRGIKTYVPATSDICKAIGQYGFGDTGTEFSLKLIERIGWLHGQDNDVLGQIRQLEAEYEHKRTSLDQQYRDASSGMDNEYHSRHEHLCVARGTTFGAIQDCEYWQRSWAISGAQDQSNVTPDRTLDPRTGIKAITPSGDSAAATNRVAKELAA